LLKKERGGPPLGTGNRKEEKKTKLFDMRRGDPSCLKGRQGKRRGGIRKKRPFYFQSPEPTKKKEGGLSEKGKNRPREKGRGGGGKKRFLGKKKKKDDEKKKKGGAGWPAGGGENQCNGTRGRKNSGKKLRLKKKGL